MLSELSTSLSASLSVSCDNRLAAIGHTAVPQPVWHVKTQSQPETTVGVVGHLGLCFGTYVVTSRMQSGCGPQVVGRAGQKHSPGTVDVKHGHFSFAAATDLPNPLAD